MSSNVWHCKCKERLQTLPDEMRSLPQVAVIRTLADEGSLHLLPPLAQCPGGPVPYLSSGSLPGAVLSAWAQLLGDGALERSLESGSAAGELALHHLSLYVFAEDAHSGA